MLTIGKHYNGPRYNYTDLCDYCGAYWHRTMMELDTDGLLRCPQCMAGLSLFDLAEIAQVEVGYIDPVLGKVREGP